MVIYSLRLIDKFRETRHDVKFKVLGGSLEKRAEISRVTRKNRIGNNNIVETLSSAPVTYIMKENRP